jgi:haloalkane dehalogenase
MSLTWRIWEKFARFSPWFPIGRILQSAVKRTLTPAEIAAYDSPFPDASFKSAVRVYPSLVPVCFDDPEAAKNRAAWKVYQQWGKPFITCYSDGDPITRGQGDRFVREVPGAQKQQHPTLRGGHFIQEDDPQGFAQLIISACTG